ncbi:hypothetical protein CMK11_08345 [Candidatus Poribacteria bacterium]|nr:hypothetical protein [Candidatus Poribacteria bacterium]
MLAPDFAKRFSLGEVALTDAYGSQERHPLELDLSMSSLCMTLHDHLPPAMIFDNYHYSSSAGLPERHIQELADTGQRLAPFGSEILEIACNDGYLLREYRRRGIRAFGVDPAANLVDPELDVRVDYFSPAVAELILDEWGQFGMVHAHNVLAHTPDPVGLLQGIRTLLEPGGKALIEVQYLRDTIEKGQFDNIYHEHYWYLTLHSITLMMMRAGLCPVEAYRTEYQGGSLRVVAEIPSTPKIPEHVLRMCEHERGAMETPGYFDRLTEAIKERVEGLWWLLDAVRNSAPKAEVYGFGASAKATVLLNLAGVDVDRIAGIFDDAETKQGLTLPGTSIPILSPESMPEIDPRTILVFPWNAFDMITGNHPLFADRMVNVREV